MNNSFFDFFENSIASSDIAKEMVETILPQQGGTALTEAIFTFNAAFLIIASAVIMFHFLIALVNTAQEGEVLGKQWHQIWAPVRVVVGVSALAPVFNGLCVAQLLVLQITMWGIGLANSVWINFAEDIANGQTIVVTEVPANAEFFKKILENEVCYQAIAEVDSTLSKAGHNNSLINMPLEKGSKSSLLPANPGHPITTDLKSFFGNDVYARRYVWDYGICGSIQRDVALEEDQKFNSGLATVSASSLVAFEQVNQINNLLPQLRNLAKRIVFEGFKKNKYPDFASLKHLQNEYQKGMLDASNNAIPHTTKEARKEFVDKARSGGFVVAGSWFMTIANLQQDLAEDASILPEVREPNLQKIEKLGEVGDSKRIQKILTSYNVWWEDQFENRGTDDGSVATASGGDSIFDKVPFLNAGKMKGLYDAFALDPNSPLTSMVSAGHTILSIAEGTVLAGFVAFVAGGTLPAQLAGITSALSFLTPLIWVIVGGIFMIGISHAYILPMFPYVMWTIAIAGWLAFVVEAFIAGPVWALFHCRLDGQNLIDQAQKPGYMLAFNLFLRPVLMVLGLILSIAVFTVMIRYVNLTFYSAMRGATAGSFVGPIGVVVMLGILTYLHWQLAIKSFSLISIVPDRVARWFGAGGENLGEEQDAQQTNAVVMGAMSNAGHKIGNKTPDIKPRTEAKEEENAVSLSAPKDNEEGK